MVMEKLSNNKDTTSVDVADGQSDLSLKLELDKADQFSRSADLQARAHRNIPGGCHTYAKGDDQYPASAPAFIERGLGCHVWDVEGREYIEYALGLRSTTLGHCWPSVTEAVSRVLSLDNNFNRPHELEVQCAEKFLELIPYADMVKFTKDGSSVMTAAVKLARAKTGRTHIALCSDSPFLSYDDWFMGKTDVGAGIPDSIRNLSLSFDYNDIDSLRALFEQHPNSIACVAMEPERLVKPIDGYLEAVRALCDEQGALLIFDETLTGFRWHLHGAQHLYGVKPDLSCFGKAMANGFALSALAGKRDVMELGGLKQVDADRVFLLSTTHGAESVGLAAGLETMSVYQSEPVIEHLHTIGALIKTEFEAAAADAGVSECVKIFGRDCSLLFSTVDESGKPSQLLRTLFLQELCAGGVLAPSLYTSFSHTEQDVQITIDAVSRACKVYRQALDNGVEPYLKGPPSQSVYRKRN